MKGTTSETELQNLIQNIVWLQRENSISERDVARLLKISEKSYRKLVRGEMPPRLNVHILFQVQKHFGIPPKDLFSVCLENKKSPVTVRNGNR